MKVLELFGGIGACTQALKRIGIDVEIADYVEIDKYAVKSYNAINGTNFEPQDITQWDKDLDVDLIMHGSPCQDFSLAGKQAGGDEGSGTRSSLMYETVRIVEKLRPKYVIWENVKNVISKKHKHNFDKYIDELTDLGYTSFYQVLNAKDYGIPQNRERVFVVSILNGTDYEFPKPQELKIRLKDILEGEVDEKYYLSKKMMNYITSNNEKWTGNNKKSIINKEIASAINTGEGTRRCDASNYVDNTLLENVDLKEVVRKYGIFDTVEAKHQAGSVYDKRGIAPTLDTMQGGYRQPCIEVVGKTRSGGERSLILDTEGISNCLTATDYKQPKQILIKNATKKGYLEATDGDGVYISAIDKKRGTVQKGMTPTIKTSVDVGVVVNDKTTISNTNDEAQQCNLLRVRKLTPKECWRLMGFSDETFEKAQKVNSNTQLYKQAGNSIVVNVLVQLFTNLLLNEKGSYFMKTKEMKLNIYRTDKMFDIEKLIKEEPELFDDLVKDYPLEEKIIMIEVAKKGA